MTILGGLNEFYVKFFGPSGSESIFPDTVFTVTVSHVLMSILSAAPYEGGVWKVRVDLPDKYPFKSPSIGKIKILCKSNIPLHHQPKMLAVKKNTINFHCRVYE